MNNIIKSIATLSAISLLLAGCEAFDKKEESQKQKPTTIEEIQAEKGKPARVVKAGVAKLNDVRKFSGSIEGMQVNRAISKMGDPLAKVYVAVGSVVKKDQVLAEYLFTGDNTQYQQAQEQVALQEKAIARLREVYEKGGVSQQWAASGPSARSGSSASTGSHPSCSWSRPVSMTRCSWRTGTPTAWWNP